MRKFERLVCSRSAFALLCARVSWLAAPALLLSCTTSHTENSTETGNAPFIDVQKVSLVVASASVRIVGQPGAVRPGGVTVEVSIVGTGEVVRSASRADGSFDIPLSASADAVVEVRAATEGERSNVVYVTRGSASVGSGDGASLSCMQRTNLASQAAANLANQADTRCSAAADCVEVSTRTVCTDTCSDALVSRSAASGIEAGIVTINRDLCRGFASDGCKVIALPCEPPPMGAVACVAGQCVHQEGSTNGPEDAGQPQDASQLPDAAEPDDAGQCTSCLSERVTWGVTGSQTTNTISGCNSFRHATSDGPGCEGSVARCVGAGQDSATITSLSAALQAPAVENALTSGSTLVGGNITLPITVSVGARSFSLAPCPATGNCAPLGDAIMRVSTLLQRVVDETSCQPLPCPPNAVYLPEACLTCGPVGGCDVGPRCAVVCSTAAECMNTPYGVCTARGLCEALCF